VIVADDDALVREQIRRALIGTPDLQLVGSARDGAEAWTIALELSPDVLVLDDRLPIVDGLRVLARLRAEAPDIRIVMYVQDPATCLTAAELGAAGCVTKGGAPDALVTAIRASGSSTRERFPRRTP
jgi:DNA-binding NarL/FixJ family response regulator